MYVVKRGNVKEQVMFDKITSRLQMLCYGLNMDVIDPVVITQKVITGLYQGVTTAELDKLAAETAITMTDTHYEYGILAARIAISNLHKETKETFTDVMSDLHNIVNPLTGKPKPLIADDVFDVIIKNADKLNSAIVYDRDYNFDYFGFKILEQSYLMKINGKVAERPQHMLMRVAVGVHGDDIDTAIEIYNLMSEKYFIYGSTTLINAATPHPQLSSHYLLTMSDDSIEGIYDTLGDCIPISHGSGKMGLNVHCIRGKGSYIAGTNGVSNGLVPMLRVYDTVKNIDHIGGKWPGDLTIYLEPWHVDIFEFLDMKKPSGKEEMRAHNLNYALWIPDLFMERVEKGEDWCLMCPHQSTGLKDCWGEDFERLYKKYENEGLYLKKIKAQDLWFSIIKSQVETGMPTIMYKDACNSKTNQKNLGTIKSGSCCAEFVAYSSGSEIAACSSASIALATFVTPERTFDFKKLKAVAKAVACTLNKIIDLESCLEVENTIADKQHRPIGIGVQGLADAFILLRYPFDSEKASILNKQIFETIYYGALEASCELAEKNGPYDTYKGCPASNGIFQFDMWGATPSDLWDWESLKTKISKHGLRNSLLVAQMPTSSTAQIFGNNKSVDPFASYVLHKKVHAEELHMMNHHLLKELQDRHLWNNKIKSQIISSNGSIQDVDEIPSDLKVLYKTTWEISQKVVLKMAADRGPFIDNSQSMSIHIIDPTYGKLSSMHFFGWKLGLKTGMYELKTRLTPEMSKNKLDKKLETLHLNQ